MDWILPLLGGLGLGSLLKSFLDFRQSRTALAKDRQYQEKREAYLGLLSALHQSAIRPSDEAAKGYALWQARCELFGSPEVARYAREMISTNDGQRESRHAAFEGLVASMRDDLRR